MGRFIKRMKEKRQEKQDERGRGGEGAFVRIQNKSSKTVTIKLVEGRNVDERGMAEIQGTLAPGKQLPVLASKSSDKKFGGHYTYMEGDVKNRFQKDGYFRIEAHPDDGTPNSSLELVVDHNSWESRDKTPDKSSSVLLVADVVEDDDDDDDDDWKIELRVYDNYHGNQWMQDLEEFIGPKKFCNVSLPGTHDSGTYKFDKDKGASPDSSLTKTLEEKLDHGRLLGKVTDKILETIFARLCQCQDKSFREQLDLGIRYLDMRIAYHQESKTYYTCHGVYCVEMTSALQEISEFLNANPKEIILLDFIKLHQFEKEQHMELCEMVVEAIGEDKVADKDDIKPTSTVQEYWDQGYQAVLLYADKCVVPKFEGKIWPRRRFITSQWPNTGDPKVLKEKLVDIVEKTTAKEEVKSFYVVQGILTPNADMIKNQLWEGDGLSIKDFSTMCSGKVVDLVEEEWKPKHTCLNVVIVDFFEDCSMLPAVINYNRM